MTGLQTVPCQIAGMGHGIALLDEKIASNSPIDQYDMRLIDFIHIVLACKCALKYIYAK